MTKQVSGQEPQESTIELNYALRYVRKDYEQQIGNGKKYDIRQLSGHGKDCLNIALPKLMAVQAKAESEKDINALLQVLKP